MSISLDQYKVNMIHVIKFDYLISKRILNNYSLFCCSLCQFDKFTEMHKVNSMIIWFEIIKVFIFLALLFTK